MYVCRHNTHVYIHIVQVRSFIAVNKIPERNSVRGKFIKLTVSEVFSPGYQCPTAMGLTVTWVTWNADPPVPVKSPDTTALTETRTTTSWKSLSQRHPGEPALNSRLSTPRENIDSCFKLLNLGIFCYEAIHIFHWLQSHLASTEV